MHFDALECRFLCLGDLWIPYVDVGVGVGKIYWIDSTDAYSLRRLDVDVDGWCQGFWSQFELRPRQGRR
jgi:hypothetical protein